jgi:hypothetical protein
MSILSLNWFKSRKQHQLDSLKIEEQELKNELLRQEIKMMSEVPTPVVENIKPYRTVKMVNDVITVVLNDGNILSKTGSTPDDYAAIKRARFEEEILSICSTQEIITERKRVEREREKAVALKKGIETLSNLDDFEVDGDSVYLKGINRTIPQLLVEEFLRIVNRNVGNRYMLAADEEFQSLKRFFMWCCLNPRAEVADKLYNFLKNNSFKITKQGFFVALRNVVTLHGSTELVQFVSNAYNKVKAVWKKSPDAYEVYLKDGQYSFIHIDDTYTTEMVEGEDWYDEEIDEYVTSEDEEVTVKRSDLGELIGNLTELYLDLPNRAENRFTDAHTQTFDIRVGRPVSMDPAKCRWNTDDCGAEGLHFTADEIHYVGCGDQSVLVLINPMKVVGIGQSKGRCWEYLPIMTVPREEATEILHDLDFDTLQLDDSYAVRELDSLAIKAKEGFTAEAKKHAFNIPAISTIEIDSIVNSLEEMKSEITNRVQILG